MRTAFCNALRQIARADPRVMLLTGDLGFTVFEEFRDTLPAQYLNTGVAEQNMIGVAAGLAMSGKRVFVYSIIPFATFRCLEHIRNDLCYHRLPVCVVGVGAGYSYGPQGATHHALEDIAVMRSLPNMSVVCPGDPLEAGAAVSAIAALDGPCYLRLGKAGEPAIHRPPVAFTIGKAITVREGKDVCIMATSTMLETGLRVAEMLEREGVGASLVSMHTVKPLDDAAVARAAREGKLIVTLEEHSRIGGLGSAVAESISLQGLPQARHLLLATPPVFTDDVGSQQYLRAKAGLDAESVCKRILETVAPSIHGTVKVAIEAHSRP